MPSNQWLTNEAQPISAGWGGPPQLSAPNIGELVKSILANRLTRDKMTQENIADTIKNVREERQSGEYLEAMKAAGLIPEDYDAGGLEGAKLGTTLAKMKQDKLEADAMEAHRAAMLGVSQGHLGVAQGHLGIARDRFGRETGPQEMVTVTINGVQHQVPLSKAIKHPGLFKGGSDQPDDKAIREQGKLLEEKGYMDAEKAKQEAEDIKALRPNVPFKRSDEYNRTVNRLKQLQERKGMPSTAPAGTPPPADTAGGHAQDYGTKAVYMKAPDGTVSPVDPNLVEYYKSKGAVIVPGT